MASTQTAVTRRAFISGAAVTAGGVVVGVGLNHGRADAATGGSVSAAVRSQAPRTKLAQAVEQLLRSSSPTFLVQHCHRSFQLALLIAAARGLHVDVEVLFAGVMLHDLGLTPTYHAPDVRFEVASATWMTTVAADHIPGFHQSSIEQLALNSPYEHPPSG